MVAKPRQWGKLLIMSNDDKVPGGGPSAHSDTFAADSLPPEELWPDFEYSLPELAAYPDRINVAKVLLDDQVAAGKGGNPVLHLAEETWTYAGLQKRVNQIARVLAEDHGLVPGNRVLLRGANTPMLVACWFAVLKAGGICVTTMPLLRARELIYTMDRGGVTHALCEAGLSDEMEEAAAGWPELKHLAFFSPAGDGAGSLETAMESKPSDFEAVDTSAGDVALIAFTSGSTGGAKGTMHFHRDVLATCDCFPRHIGKIGETDVVTGTPPLAFTFGLGGLTVFPMRYGASTRFLTAPAPDEVLDTIQRYGVTQIYTAPTAYRAMADLWGKYDISSLRQGISAGETLPKATWEAFRDATGIRLIDGLGATEMFHIFVSETPGNMRAGFTGRAIPGYRAKVVGDDGNEAPPGTPGQLAVKGPTGCRYINDIERQKMYVKDGWNYPGDVYEMSDDGYFRYVARGDDMIISSGYNISGPEVEAMLLEHPAVAECAVVASPDPDRTNIVKAFIVPRPGTETGEALSAELQDFVKNGIAPYKYPRAVEYIDELPKTQTGKVQRFVLRQREWEKS